MDFRRIIQWLRCDRGNARTASWRQAKFPKAVHVDGYRPCQGHRCRKADVVKFPIIPAYRVLTRRITDRRRARRTEPCPFAVHMAVDRHTGSVTDLKRLANRRLLDSRHTGTGVTACCVVSASPVAIPVDSRRVVVLHQPALAMPGSRRILVIFENGCGIDGCRLTGRDVIRAPRHPGAPSPRRQPRMAVLPAVWKPIRMSGLH